MPPQPPATSLGDFRRQRAAASHVEDLVALADHPTISFSTSGSTLLPVCICRAGGLEVVSLAIAFMQVNASPTGVQTFSDSAYWQAEIYRYRQGAINGGVIATKNTKNTLVDGIGREQITALQPWAFDTATFDTSSRNLRLNDLLVLKLIPTGTPLALSGYQITARLERK